MIIPPISVSTDTAPIRAVSPSEVSTPTAVTAPAGPAVTWWVSPPGQFFSVLHELSQRFPVELWAALAGFAEGTTAGGTSVTGPDASTMASISSEIAHGSPAARRRVAPAALPYAPLSAATHAPGALESSSLAPASPLARLLATMQRLAQDNPAAFQAISTGLATNLEAVARGATGDDRAAMATLATQLQLSAQMATPDPSRTDHEAPAGGPEPDPVQAAVAEEPAVDEGSDARPPLHLLRRTDV